MAHLGLLADYQAKLADFIILRFSMHLEQHDKSTLKRTLNRLIKSVM